MLFSFFLLVIIGLDCSLLNDFGFASTDQKAQKKVTATNTITETPFAEEIKKINFIHHTQPEIIMDFSPFEAIGCADDLKACAKLPELAEFGCDLVRKPVNYLAGISPGVSVMQCVMLLDLDRKNPEKQKIIKDHSYFFRDNCLLGYYIRYIFYSNNKFWLVRDMEELKSAFSPVDTDNEALGFALFYSNLRAGFDNQYQPGMTYEVNEIEDTHIEKAEDGYHVHLFRQAVCGCGKKPFSAVEVLITNEGDVKQIYQKELYFDPTKSKLCID